MIENHPFYSRFQLKKESADSKVYVFENIKILLYTEPKYKVKSVTVMLSRPCETLITGMLYKNEEELTFILDRVADIRLACSRCISLPSVVETFGQF